MYPYSPSFPLPGIRVVEKCKTVYRRIYMYLHLNVLCLYLSYGLLSSGAVDRRTSAKSVITNISVVSGVVRLIIHKPEIQHFRIWKYFTHLY